MNIKDNNTFCFLPYMEIFSNNAGNYKLCCEADPSPHNDYTMSPIEWLNSKYLSDSKSKMLQGEKLPECHICYKMEEAGGKSSRTENNMWNYVDDDFNISSIPKPTIRMHLGSYCNLSCYMCHPQNSSTRLNELNATMSKEEKNKIFGGDQQLRSVSGDQFENIIDFIIKSYDKISGINLIGGEPLIMPQCWNLLERIPSEIAKHLNIAINTNLTVLGLKDKDLLWIKNKFKSLYLVVSVDHYGDKLKFIRYPINISDFETNLTHIIKNDIQFKIAITVSILNVLDLSEIEKYYKTTFNLENIVFKYNTVYDPEILSPNILPASVKNLLLHNPVLDNKVKSMVNIVSTDSYSKWNNATAYLDKLSAHRKLDWRNLFKELILIVDENYSNRIEITSK